MKSILKIILINIPITIFVAIGTSYLFITTEKQTILSETQSTFLDEDNNTQDNQNTKTENIKEEQSSKIQLNQISERTNSILEQYKETESKLQNLYIKLDTYSQKDDTSGVPDALLNEIEETQYRLDTLFNLLQVQE